MYELNHSQSVYHRDYEDKHRERGKPVLAFDKTMYDENSRMQAAVLTDDGDWLTTFDEKRLENVTHWMPLPDEPKDNE